MSIYYISHSGLNTAPYDTEGKAATTIKTAINYWIGLGVGAGDAEFEICDDIPYTDNCVINSGTCPGNLTIRPKSGVLVTIMNGILFYDTLVSIHNFTIEDLSFGLINTDQLIIGIPCNDIIIQRNTFSQTYTGGGLSIGVGNSSGLINNLTIENNLFFTPSAIFPNTAIEVSGFNGNNVLINKNTFYNYALGVKDSYGSTTIITAKNNIFYNIGVAIIQNTATTISQYNCFYLCGNNYQGTVESKIGDIYTDPLFYDAPTDFRLLPTSPCIGAGEGGMNIGAAIGIVQSTYYIKSTGLNISPYDTEENAATDIQTAIDYWRTSTSDLIDVEFIICDNEIYSGYNLVGNEVANFSKGKFTLKPKTGATPSITSFTINSNRLHNFLSLGFDIQGIKFLERFSINVNCPITSEINIQENTFYSTTAIDNYILQIYAGNYVFPATPSMCKITIEKNVLIGVDNIYGIELNGYNTDSEIINNTFYNLLSPCREQGGVLTYKNNIIYNCTFGITNLQGRGVVSRYNCFYNVITQYGAGVEPFIPVTDKTGDIVADPLFVSTSDFHLTWGSPCIDTGEGGVDRGAYDYNTIIGFQNTIPALSIQVSTAVIDTDETLNAFTFTLDGNIVGYIDVDGCHDGSPV